MNIRLIQSLHLNLFQSFPLAALSSNTNLHGTEVHFDLVFPKTEIDAAYQAAEGITEKGFEITTKPQYELNDDTGEEQIRVSMMATEDELKAFNFNG